MKIQSNKCSWKLPYMLFKILQGLSLLLHTNYLWTYDLYGPIFFWGLKQLERSGSCLGPKKSSNGQVSPTNGFASIKHITYMAVSIRGP